VSAYCLIDRDGQVVRLDGAPMYARTMAAARSLILTLGEEFGVNAVGAILMEVPR
jgi:hypothetical protein